MNPPPGHRRLIALSLALVMQLLIGCSSPSTAPTPVVDWQVSELGMDLPETVKAQYNGPMFDLFTLRCGEARIQLVGYQPAVTSSVSLFEDANPTALRPCPTARRTLVCLRIDSRRNAMLYVLFEPADVRALEVVRRLPSFEYQPLTIDDALAAILARGVRATTYNWLVEEQFFDHLTECGIRWPQETQVTRPDTKVAGREDADAPGLNPDSLEYQRVLVRSAGQSRVSRWWSAGAITSEPLRFGGTVLPFPWQ